MITFLFWNLARKSLENIIADIAIQYDVDILMFTECAISPGRLLPRLNQENVAYQYVPPLNCKTIEIYTRFSSEYIAPIYEEDRFTVRHLALPGLTDILLAVTHSISKLNYSEDDQTVEAQILATSIREAERIANLTRTVLIGDLNMNPFEDGMVSASSLHGVMSQQVARKGQRVIQNRSYPFFYNPMWSLLGDFSPGPPGTYYYWTAQQKVFFWNMFDQVLIRPDLLDRFDSRSLKIIDSVGESSLLSEEGLPDKEKASDHLPLLFVLDL